jgi:hypothetical protein
MKSGRRTFLQLAATGAVTATGMMSGLSLGGAGRARAQGPLPRFLFIYNGHGWTPRAFFMRPPGLTQPSWGHWSDILRIGAGVLPNTTPENSEFEFSLADVPESDASRLLAPVWAHRRKMMAFEGLAMLSTAFDMHGDAHAQNHLASFTAGPAAYEYEGQKSHAAYPSIDYRVLEHIRASTDDPLAFAMHFNPNQWRSSGTDGFHYGLYAPNTDGSAMERVPTEGDPQRAAMRLFGGLDLGMEEAERRAMAQRAMFAQLQRHYGELVNKTSGFDRGRLEEHRDLLSGLETSLSRPRPMCTNPTIGSISGVTPAEAQLNDFDSFANIITASFGCGLSRVATLSVGLAQELYGIDPSVDVHHAYEHNSDPVSYYLEGGGNIEAEAGLIRRNEETMKMVEKVISLLDGMTDSDGSKVLDNTIVLYANEAADGAHGTEFCPFLVFGGGNIGLRTGTYLKYPQNLPNPWGRNYRNEYTGTPHTRLYIALLQAMGVDIDYIHAASVEGSVPHAFPAVRGTIDMSGPLERVRRT